MTRRRAPVDNDGEDGLCADDDPHLSPELSERARRWSERFLSEFHYETGWPDAQTAQEHEAEGEALYAAIRTGHSHLGIEFQHWERAHR